MQNRYSRWYLLGAVLVGSSLFLAAAGPEAGAQDPRPAVGHRAPDFTLPNLRGTPVRLSNFRGKKAVFINFWATWCPPCRLEMSTMERAYQAYNRDGFEILAVSIDAGPKSIVKNFMEQFKLTFPALLDPDMKTLGQFRIFAIPASFLVDKDGVIRFRELGYRDWTDGESTKMLEDLLR
ncbi:MAG: peroxiredoxin family protein [Candidatus Methylomirabilales bacterium]